MNGGFIEVYCDGSMTNAVMTDPFTSDLGGDYIGRAMVVIPALDFGLIEQKRAGMVTELGMPRSSEAEAFAVRTALKVCTDLGLANYIVSPIARGSWSSSRTIAWNGVRARRCTCPTVSSTRCWVERATCGSRSIFAAALPSPRRIDNHHCVRRQPCPRALPMRWG